jgi:hypothetical protein
LYRQAEEAGSNGELDRVAARIAEWGRQIDQGKRCSAA